MKQKASDKYEEWKNNINNSFNKATIPLDDLSSATNSLLKTKHLQSPFENNTEDFLNECLPWIVTVILNSTIKGERFAKNTLSFLSNVVKIIALFIDYDENNKENSTITIHNIWKFYDKTRIIFSQRNSNFYQCYQTLTQENPINTFKSKIDINFFTRINQYFKNLSNPNQIPKNNTLNDSSSDTKNNSDDNNFTISGLERIRTTLSLIFSFNFCFQFSSEIIEAKNKAIQSILTYFFSLFFPYQSNTNESNDNQDDNSCIINLRTLDEKLFETILDLFKSLCSRELKEEFINDELYICTKIANCQYLNKQFFAFKLIKGILSSSLKDSKECQVLYDLQFIDQILKNNDLHEELVKPFSEIFVKMMRNKLIKKKEHIQMYWNLVVIKQHSSTIGPFLSGLETIITATKTGISNHQINANYHNNSQRIFDEEMTDALLESVIEKNVFPTEVIQFFGKGILNLNQKQNRLLFDTLNNIYFKLTSNDNEKSTEPKNNDNNENNENDNIKIIGKPSSNLFTEQETYINELIKTLCTLVPPNSEDIEESCLKFIQNHDSTHLNYAISLLQASIINSNITPEKADTYLNLLIDSMSTTDLLNISQYIQLLSKIILQLKKLHKKQFNTLLNFTKSIFPINSSQFCTFYRNLIEQSTSKQFLSTKLIDKLFQETCSLSEENSFFNEEIMNFLLYLYQKLDMKSNCLDSNNENIKFIWNLLFKTNSEFASSFLLHVYKNSGSETAINDFINQCIQHIDNYGSLMSILSLIDSYENEEQPNNFKEFNFFSRPNLFICEEDDFYSINFTGTVNARIKMHFDSSYDDVLRKAALYLGITSDEVELYDQKTNKLINRSNFEIQNGKIYRVKKLKKSKSEEMDDFDDKPKNLPAKILIENKDYSKSLFNALKSDDDLVALTAYKILNKIPPLKEFLCPILYLNVKQTKREKNKSDENNENDQKEDETKSKKEYKNENQNENENDEENKNQQEKKNENDEENKNKQEKKNENNDENKTNDFENKNENGNENDEENTNNKNDDNENKNDEENTNNKNVDNENKNDNDTKNNDEFISYDYNILHPDWSKTFDKSHKYLLLYQSNTIGNILKEQFDPEWISFFFETGGAFEFMKISLSSNTEEEFKIREHDFLTILHIAVLIVKENKWKDLVTSVSSHFNKEEVIDQIMNLTNSIQISLTIFLLQSILTKAEITDFFNDDGDNKFKTMVKKMLFYKNIKIRRSIKDLISFIIESTKDDNKDFYEKQENFYLELLNIALLNEKTCDSYFSIMQIFSTKPQNPLKIWKTTIQLLFDKFTIPETDEFVEKLTYEMASTELAIQLIIILSNISTYYSNNCEKENSELEELPDQEKLLSFILNQVLFNGIKYFRLVNELFELISFILKKNPNLADSVVQKIKENQEQMKILSKQAKPDSDYDFSNYQNEDNYSSNKYNFLSTNLKHRGIRNLGATCYINSTIQQLFSINEMKKILLDENYSMDDWSGNLQLAFAQLLLYPTSYIDLTPFVKHWNGWDGSPINPREQQDAVEFLQMLFGRMEETMPSFKSLFEGTFQYHFKSCNDNVSYENDTFDNFTMLPLEVKGMNGIEDSFRMFVQPEIFNDYKIDNHNGFSGKIDVEKYSMIKKAPEILVIQLKRFEYNLSTCTREKLNSKYMFDYELDLAPIMMDQEEPFIYELFGIQMHSGSAQGGHYFSYIKYPKNENNNNNNNVNDNDNEQKYVWLRFNDTNVSFVDKSTLIDLCCGGNTIIDTTDESGTSTTPTIIENSSNAYLLYYRKKKKNENEKIENKNIEKVENKNTENIEKIENEKIENTEKIENEKIENTENIEKNENENENEIVIEEEEEEKDSDNENENQKIVVNKENSECSIDSIIKNMNKNLITNLSKDVKKLILSNIFSSEFFSNWIINNIIKYDQKGEILYYFILMSFKKSTSLSKRYHYSSTNNNKDTENLVNVAINTMNSQISSQKENNNNTNNEFLCSLFANYIIEQSDDIIYYLLVEENLNVRQLFLRMLEKAVETSDFSVRVSLIAFLQTKIMDGPFCSSVLLKNWEHFDTFFQSFLTFPRTGYISGEWSNVFASFLFDSFIPYCETNEKGVIYANIDLSSFFTIFTNCQMIQNKKLIESKPSKSSSKQLKIKASASGTATMSVITGNRTIDKTFVENFLLSQKHLHSFVKFLLEYPPFDISTVLNLKSSDIEQMNTSFLARYYILSVWSIDKISEKLYNLIVTDPNKEKNKEIDKTKKFYQNELMNKRNDAIKLNKIITDHITNGKKIEKRVSSFLSTLSTLISFSSDLLYSTQSMLEFRSIFIHTLKLSSFYPIPSPQSLMLVSNSTYNSIYNSYSTSSIITKFITSENASYRSLIFQYIKKIISINNGLNDDQFCLNKIESGELFRILYGRIEVIYNLLSSKEMNKMKKEDFNQVNPSTDYFLILTKLAKMGDFNYKLAYYEIARTLISLMKSFGQLTKKQPVIDCFNFIFESIGVEYADIFFTPVSNREKASDQSVLSTGYSSYRDFLHGFDRFKSKNEYKKKTTTTTNNNFNYGFSSYTTKKDEDDVYSYENESDSDSDDEYSDFVNFNDDSQNNNFNSLHQITLRVISFIPSFGYDLFFESKFFNEIAGTQYLEKKSDPNNGESFTNMLFEKMNDNNVYNIVKALLKKKIFVYYLKNFSKAYFRLINRVLKKYPVFAPKIFIEQKSPLFVSILKQIKNSKSKLKNSDSTTIFVSMLSKTMSLIIFSTLSTKSTIYFKMNNGNKKIFNKKKSDDDSNLNERYDLMKRKYILLLNQTEVSVKDVYKYSLVVNGNGLAYLLTALSFLSEKLKNKAFKYISKNFFMKIVPQNARKSASFAVSRICYRYFNSSLFYLLSYFCNDLSKSSKFKFKSSSMNSNSNSSSSLLIFNAIKEKVDELKFIELERISMENDEFKYCFNRSTFDLFDDEFNSNNNSVSFKKSLSVKIALKKIVDEVNASVESDIFDVKNVGNNLMAGIYMILSLLKMVTDSMIFVLDKSLKLPKGSATENDESFSIKKTSKFVSSLFNDAGDDNNNDNEEVPFSINNLIVPTLTKIFSKSLEINDDRIFIGDFLRIVDLILSSKSGNLNGNIQFTPFDFKLTKETAQLWVNSAANLLSSKIKETIKSINRDLLIQSRDAVINIFAFIDCIINKFNGNIDKENEQQVEWPPLNVTEAEIIELAQSFEINQNRFCQDAAELLTRLMSVSPLLPNE